MARAARAAFERLIAEVPEPELVQILCGPGNNGGDGWLLAMLCVGRGLPTRVFRVGGGPRSEDAVLASERARDAGIDAADYSSGALSSRGLVIDAMLGTGLAGAPREAYAKAIREVNDLGLPVLALDIPSGVNADTGHAYGDAIQATWTLSFITAKRGLYTGAGRRWAGAVSVDDLGVPDGAYGAVDSPVERLKASASTAFLPPRPLQAHKGDLGRCLLIGGDLGMGGALILAAEAALRCGVGLARAATRPEHTPALLARRPECMVLPVTHRNHLGPFLSWASALALGPGLGQQPWGAQLLHAALRADRPMVLDADALNLLAQRAQWPLPPSCVITPHPGEAARLLGTTAADIEKDRFAAAQTLAQRCGATVVLKGPGTVIVGASGTALCDAGNPGMASGGMGDVLTGVIAALLAQGLEPEAAARRGVLLHSHAADLAAQSRGVTALLASDVIDAMGELLP